MESLRTLVLVLNVLRFVPILASPIIILACPRRFYAWAIAVLIVAYNARIDWRETTSTELFFSPLLTAWLAINAAALFARYVFEVIRWSRDRPIFPDNWTPAIVVTLILACCWAFSRVVPALIPNDPYRVVGIWAAILLVTYLVARKSALAKSPVCLTIFYSTLAAWVGVLAWVPIIAISAQAFASNKSYCILVQAHLGRNTYRPAARWLDLSPLVMLAGLHDDARHAEISFDNHAQGYWSYGQMQFLDDTVSGQSHWYLVDRPCPEKRDFVSTLRIL